MAWTDELKATVIEAYTSAEPTPENSSEIIKEIAEEHEQSPNGVRMVLVQAGVYVKKEPAAGGKTKAEPKGDGPKRVSKESSIAALRAAIELRGGVIDDEILEKLTGKAAIYFTSVISA